MCASPAALIWVNWLISFSLFRIGRTGGLAADEREILGMPAIALMQEMALPLVL